MKILYLFSISIVVSGSLYPVFALDTPQVCDANSLPHYGPHNPSHIYIKDTSGNLPYIPLTDHTAILHDDDVWNTYPEPRIIQVTLIIHNQDTGQLVFNQTQSLQMQACSGPESVKWRFVPIQVANYIATISDDRGKENMIFNSILDVPKSQTVSSPLEQLKFRIDLHNIICKQDLQLVIKSEDGSPACVKQGTATKLVERGWAKMISKTGVAINSYTPISNATENQAVKVVEIKMVPPYTPGGPVIQLTIQNVGAMPITHLDVTLETNHNYTFNFKSITSSTPLISGNSISDTTMLVGGGFQTESAYRLIINGMESNMPFGYIENVHIKG